MPEIRVGKEQVKQNDTQIIEKKGEDKLKEEDKLKDEVTQSQQPKSEVIVVEKQCGKTGGITNSDKWVIAIIIGIIVLILFSPFFFRLTNYLFRGFGLPTCTPDGKPTIAGLIIHTILLIVLVRILMH